MIPYETHMNLIGVRLCFLLKDTDQRHDESIDLFSYAAYQQQAYKRPDLRLREGRGKGNEVLIRWDALDIIIRQQLIEKFGDPIQDFNPLEEFYCFDDRARIFYEGFKNEDDNSHLSPEQIAQYTTNASVLNALGMLKQKREVMSKMSGSRRNVWPSCIEDLNAFVKVLKTKHRAVHSLPQNERRLRETLLAYLDSDYSYLIDNRSRNKNAAKIKDDSQQALLAQLLRKHNNFDNEQIAEFYNMAAIKLKWKFITGSTVANHRAKLGLYIYSGSRGETNFRNNKAMQVKRKAPTVAMAYWTLDGWDAELLYQKEVIDENGKRTTYHNRLTVVVVLDPSNKYPVGYAIGDHETPALITEALRDAANHTRELFGERFRPLQLQSDRYQIKTLTPLYEAMTKHFTPARVKNSKSKVVERYFLHLNKQCQKYFQNWSGFGVTADKGNQPNADYLNKVRHSFPNEQECRAQIERLIQMERDTKVEEYRDRWTALPTQDRLQLSTSDYLYLFGQTHTHTNRLRGEGFTPTLLGETYSFDTFDQRFREMAFMDWAVKYDPSDLSTILVLNAKADRATSKLKEIVGTHRFELSMKHEQPMALYDRKDGDAAAYHQVLNYNKQLEQSVIDRASKDREEVERLFIEQPQLNDTLVKMVLTDSKGQHKDPRNEPRKIAAKKIISLPAAKVEREDYEILDDDVRREYGRTTEY